MASKRRYKGLKGKLWEIFSKYVRIRDFLKHGTCISCGNKLPHWKLGDAGHYVAAGHCGFGLLFDEKNVNLQCKKCNNPKWTPDATIPYGLELDKRFGKGTAAKLWNRRFTITKEHSQTQYQKEIDKYTKRFKKLEEQFMNPFRLQKLR
jgi:5-methylcytosine-specific restriction endonuclease McrA